MQRAVSSSDSSVDDSGIQDFKAAQAAQFRKLGGAPNPVKFKDAQAFKQAQAEALRADPIRQTPTLKNQKPRSNSIDQTPTGTRTRSTQQPQTPASAAQLLQFFGGDTKDAKETRQLLHSALAQLDASSRRLAHSDAERRALESSQLAQAAQTLQTASVVQQNAAEVQAQLSLAQMQLETAQNEILRAQGVVRTLESQRDDAEQHASRARALARKLQSENRALVAREEGRREGYEAGFTHGKAIAHEQRRLEADIEIRRQRQIAAVVPEPGSAFIEELPGEEEGRRNHNHNNGSRGVEGARRPPPQAQAQTRARRGTVGSMRTIEARPAEPPPFTVLINNRPPPPSQRPASVASARRVSAPPVVTQQQLPRARTASIDSRARPPSRSSTVTPTPASNPYRTSSSASRSQSQQTQTHARQNSTASRSSAGLPPPPTSSNTTTGAAAATFAGNAPSQHRDPRRRTSSTSALVEAMMPRNIPPPPQPQPTMPMPAPVTVVMPPPVVMTMPMPTHVPMPPPPPGAVGLSMPAHGVTQAQGPPVLPRMQLPPQMQQFEVERARSPSSVSTSLRTLRLTSFPVTATAGGSERDYPAGAGGAGYGAGVNADAGVGAGRERELSVIMEHAQEGSPSPLGSVRVNENTTGNSGWGNTHANANRNANASGWERRQTPWDTQRQQQQAQARGSSPYSDPSGVALEEWRRGTDEEAPRNTLPPPSPVTSPGMLSPNDPRPNVHQQTSQESFNSNLRRSSSGSSERTVNITIVPPSRPPSTGHSSGLPTEPRFLSPHHVGGTPVVPEEDEDDEEDEDEESDGSDAMPPGYVMGPLPAFAQGVTYPPGFVPMSVGPAPIGLPLVGVDGQIMAQPPGVRVQGPQAQVLQNAQMQNAQMQSQVPMPMQSQPPIQMGAGTTGAPVREWRASEQQLQQPRPASRQGGGIYGANGNGTATWTAPPLIGANAMEPARPPSRQMGAILGNPATNVVWGANALGAQLSRPSSRQGGMLGNPNPVNAARAAFTVEPARPSSRLGNPNPGNAGRGGAPPLTVEPVARPLSRQMGGMPGNTNANATAWGGAPPLTAERPSSRQGGMLGNPNAAGANTGWGGASSLMVEPVPRPLSRQMGGMLGNPGNPNTVWSGAPALTTERPLSRQGGMLGNPNAGWGGAPSLMVEPVPRPLSRQMGGMLGNPGNPNAAWSGAPALTTERPLSRQGGMLGNPNAAGANAGWGGVPPFTVEPVARPLSRQMLGNPANANAAAWGGAPALTAERPPSRQGGTGHPNAGWGGAPPLTVEPVARPLSRQMGGILGNPALGAPQQPSGPPAAQGPNWMLGGQYAFGQSSTPATQPPPPLGFVPSVSNAPHSPQPTRPLSFAGADTLRSTTPRPIYGPPAGNAAFGTGYPAQTPGVAAGYPLPASRSNSTATTTPHQRVASLNAGTTPAAFNPRALSRPASRASSGGFTRYNNNQTPHPGTNLGITNPYTSIAEESPGSASSGSSLGLDLTTANNTFVNATAGYAGGPVVPVIPPSPANSYRPMR